MASGQLPLPLRADLRLRQHPKRRLGHSSATRNAEPSTSPTQAWPSPSTSATSTTFTPPTSRLVGERLSLLARHIVFGENIIASGPLFRLAYPSDGAMHVWFHNADGLQFQRRLTRRLRSCRPRRRLRPRHRSHRRRNRHRRKPHRPQPPSTSATPGPTSPRRTCTTAQACPPPPSLRSNRPRYPEASPNR